MESKKLSENQQLLLINTGLNFVYGEEGYINPHYFNSLDDKELIPQMITDAYKKLLFLFNYCTCDIIKYAKTVD